MRASLGTRVRLLCRSTEYGVFGDVTFVLWAHGASQFHLGKDMVLLFPLKYSCVQRRGGN